MANILTPSKLSALEGLLDQGRISDFYTLLLGEGYAYAGWARGVANADSISGRAAMDFLST